MVKVGKNVRNVDTPIVARHLPVSWNKLCLAEEVRSQHKKTDSFQEGSVQNSEVKVGRSEEAKRFSSTHTLQLKKKLSIVYFPICLGE